MARRRVGAAAPEDEVPGVTNLEPLATGRGSTVYRAWQPALNRWVAVKVLGITLADGGARDRFVRECSAVGRLTGHPNIVTVLTAGVTRSSRPYLTMDLCEQGSLADVTRTSGPVPVELVLRYGVKLAGALETAHRAGILHRDLKPENVLVSRFGEPGVADFGLATLGEARGTTEAVAATHAAPEVLDGRPVTPATDVYGLASTLWTALAGRLPFGDGSEGPLKMMLRVLREPVPPLGRPDVPPAVEEALRWAMAKEPAERAPTALDFGQRLQSIQVDLGLPVTELVVPTGSTPDDPGPAGGLDTARPLDPLARPGRPRPTGGAAADPGPVGGTTPVRPLDGPGGARRAGALAGSDPDPGAGPSGTPEPSGVPWPAQGAEPSEPREPSAPAEPRLSNAATMVLPRRPPPARPPAPPGAEARRSPSRLTPIAIVAGALVLAAAMVGGAVLATRSSGGGSSPQTTVAPGPGPGTATSSPSVTTTGILRTPTAVVARINGPLTVLVTWQPPADRSGLTGFVVAHRSKQATDPITPRPVGDPDAVEAEVSIPSAGSRCFVVQAVFDTGPGPVSEPVCT